MTDITSLSTLEAQVALLRPFRRLFIVSRESFCDFPAFIQEDMSGVQLKPVMKSICRNLKVQ